MPKTAALHAAVFQLSAKNLRGGVQTPPGPARVNSSASVKGYIFKINVYPFDILAYIWELTRDGSWVHEKNAVEKKFTRLYAHQSSSTSSGCVMRSYGQMKKQMIFADAMHH